MFRSLITAAFWRQERTLNNMANKQQGFGDTNEQDRKETPRRGEDTSQDFGSESR
jgi:hypothetical protein